MFKFFSPQTVDQADRVFTTYLSDLERIKEANKAESTALSARINNLHNQRIEAQREAGRAQARIDRINNILGDAA